jgi:hypothetical protein
MNSRVVSTYGSVWMATVLCFSCGSKDSNPSVSEQEIKCRRDCEATRAPGVAPYEAFADCLSTSCKQFDPESEEYGNCTGAAFDPTNPAAACKAQTAACFSGPIAGCKELLEFAEERCEPATLPVTSEMAALEMIWCLIESGWYATPAVQAKAWPLFGCVMNDPPQGCGEQCAQGRGPCRACAQEACGELYDACIADTAATTDTTLPADKRACQEIHTCVNWCLF